MHMHINVYKDFIPRVLLWIIYAQMSAYVIVWDSFGWVRHAWIEVFPEAYGYLFLDHYFGSNIHSCIDMSPVHVWTYESLSIGFDRFCIPIYDCHSVAINPFSDLPCLYICINCSSSPCFYSYIQRFVCQFDAYLLVSYILLYKSVWMSLLWLYMYMNQFATIGLITHIQAWMSLMLWVSTICVYKSTCCHGFDCMYLNQFAAPILITYNYIYEFSLVWSNPYIYKLLIPMHMRFLWSLMWLYISPIVLLFWQYPHIYESLWSLW